MNNFFDNDFLVMIGYILLVTLFENLNPWVVFIGGILVIIAAIYKIIDLHLSIKERKKRLRKED